MATRPVFTANGASRDHGGVKRPMTAYFNTKKTDPSEINVRDSMHTTEGFTTRTAGTNFNTISIEMSG